MRAICAAASAVLFLAACSEPAPPPQPAAPASSAASAPEPTKALAAAQPQPSRPDPDVELAAKVKRALEAERELGAQGIDVTASGGIVRLFGTVDSAAKRKRAESLAAAVPGTASVENKLQVVRGS